MSDLLIATGNQGKQRELQRLLAGLPGRVVTPQEIGLQLEVEEPHLTYAENASEKAMAYASASGLLSIADDSGIEVAALDWGPGVRSARLGRPGGDAERLLRMLGAAPDRRARMVCWIAIGIPAGPSGLQDAAAATEPRVELFSGTVEGRVAEAPRGDHGFGYDPVFELPDGRTTAELAEHEKDEISHRGRAVAAARPRLAELLAAG